MKCSPNCPIYENSKKPVIVHGGGPARYTFENRCMLNVEGECKALALVKFIKRTEGF